MTNQPILNAHETALLVALLDGHMDRVRDTVALYGLQRKNLVQYGPAGWHLTYAGSVIAVEIEENR